MAVGIVYAGILSGKMQITLSGALALSIGIAIQNIPEGAIISMPLNQRVWAKESLSYTVYFPELLNL